VASYDALINLKVRGLKDLSKIDNAVNGITKGAKDTTEAVKNGNKALMTQGLRLRALAKGQNTLIEKMHKKGGKGGGFLLPDSKTLNASARGIKRYYSEQQTHAKHINRVQEATLSVEKRRLTLNKNIAKQNRISAKVGKNIRSAKAAAHREELRTLQQIINLRKLADSAGGIAGRLGALGAPEELKTRGPGGRMLALPSAEMRAGAPGAFQNAPGFRGTKTSKGSGALQSALISGAFPMLFGQGPLGGAAGFAGGYLGTKMGGQMGGFAGGLVATAALQSIQNAVSAITKLGQALNPFTADIGKLSQALGIAGTAEGARLKAIEALSGKQAALTEATRLMNQQLGAAATQTLKVFGEKMQGVSNEFAKVMTRLGAVFADLITETGILDLLQGILKFINGIDVQKMKGFTQIMLAMSGKGNFAQLASGIKIMTSKNNSNVDKDPTIGITTVGSRADMFLGNEKEKRMDELNIVKETLEGGKELGRIEKLRVDLKNKLKAFSIDINDLDKESIDTALKGLSDQDKLIESYKKQLELTEQIKSVIADGMTNAITGLIDGTKTLGESLAGIAKQIANLILQQAILSAIGGINFKGSNSIAANNIQPLPKLNRITGNPGARTAPIMPRAAGGYVTRPEVSLIGEAGENEYVIPASKMASSMQRYSAGARGDSVVAGGGSSYAGGGAGGSTTVNYSGPILNFNSEEFVPKSAVGQIIATATSRGAKAGEARTLSSLQNSRSRRSNLGL
jgi:hypothetical protein